MCDEPSLKSTSAESQLPFFSIVIPTYGRPQKLAACLQAIAQLIYPPHRFEIVVVNDNHNSGVREVVTCFTNQLDLTLLSHLHAGPATARNTGAAHARGEYLAFTDDDCTPAPDWLAATRALPSRPPGPRPRASLRP